jgi:biopolymer transport protein ExbD
VASAGNQSNETISLNLNPMLDVFSILITFLLMSFSTDPVSHDVNPALELPDSLTSSALDEVPAIVVTPSEILVNDKKIAGLIDGDVEERYRSQGAILPLFETLKQLAEVNERVNKLARGKNSDKSTLNKITMEMDKKHKFKLMKRIMLTAQQAEFVTFKLAVAREGS